MAASSGPDIIDDGLVFCVDAKNTKSYPGSGTTWFDLALNNNGTLHNSPTFSEGHFIFDGTNSVSIDAFQTQTGVNQYTWNLWVKSPSSVTSYDMIMSTNYSYLYLSFYQDKITFDSNITGVDRFFDYSASTWYHLVVCVDGVANTTKCYVNASEEHSDVAADTLDGHRLWLGQWYNNQHRLTGGNIGPVQIYNRALSASEVLQNYNAQKERFGF